MSPVAAQLSISHERQLGEIFVQPTPELFDNTLLEPGTRVGHYELDEHMATTDMSVVYAARNVISEEPVAVKLPRDEDSADRLREEIVMHSRFTDNLYVVTIDGTGVFQDNPFLATRRQEGGTLDDDIRTAQATTRNSAGLIKALISQIDKGLIESDTAEARTLDYSEVRDAVRSLDGENLIRNITTDTDNLDAEAVVHVVADAAGEHGHAMSPDSPLALATARELLEQEALRDPTGEAPDYDTILRRTHVLRGVALGVEALNRMGVVHADVKTRNAAKNKMGDGRLLDLGIAAQSRMTTVSSPLGSFGSIPPEGYLGFLTLQTDPFGISATAYRAYTGKLPYMVFPNDASATYRYMLDHDPIHVCELNDRVPAGLGNAVMLGLAQDPCDRARTSELRQAFELHL